MVITGVPHRRSALVAEDQQGDDNLSNRTPSPTPSSVHSNDTMRTISMEEEDNVSSWLHPVKKRGNQNYSSSTITRKRVSPPSPVMEAPPEKKYNLFHHTSEKKKFQWELPQELAEYYNDNNRKYMLPKEIDESITHELPVPSNIDKVPVMDDFITTMISSVAGRS